MKIDEITCGVGVAQDLQSGNGMSAKDWEGWYSMVLRIH